MTRPCTCCTIWIRSLRLTRACSSTKRALITSVVAAKPPPGVAKHVPRSLPHAPLSTPIPTCLYPPGVRNLTIESGSFWVASKLPLGMIISVLRAQALHTPLGTAQPRISYLMRCICPCPLPPQLINLRVAFIREISWPSQAALGIGSLQCRPARPTKQRSLRTSVTRLTRQHGRRILLGRYPYSGSPLVAR